MWLGAECFINIFSSLLLVSLRLFSDVTIKLSCLFSFLMSDLTLYLGNVFIVPPFSKKIDWKQYSAWFRTFLALYKYICVRNYSYYIFSKSFRNLQACSLWSINVHATLCLRSDNLYSFFTIKDISIFSLFAASEPY